MGVHNLSSYVSPNSTPLTSSQTPLSQGDFILTFSLHSVKEFESDLQSSPIAVLDCFATWCGPCKVIAPHVVTLSEKYPAATFYKFDVDEVPDLAQELGIRAMPTFLIFKKGDKVGEVVGANPRALEAAVAKAIEQAEKEKPAE